MGAATQLPFIGKFRCWGCRLDTGQGMLGDIVTSTISRLSFKFIAFG